jgi:hypothetical protein
MSWIQKTLITLGAFWLSVWASLIVGWPLGKITSRITYSDTIFSAFALGVMHSLDRALTAILAGVLVTMVVGGRKAELWSVIVAALYLAYAPRVHWVLPQTSSDRIWQSVALVFPPIACVVAAIITARLRSKRSNAGDVAQPSSVG